MNTSDDYPRLATLAGVVGLAAHKEAARALDEITRLRVVNAAVEPVLEWFWLHGTRNRESAELVRLLLDAFNAANGRGPVQETP